ncbi:MAG TPA: putative baseplate assembly protein [Pyrinomonadaceae bacterium]|nr:putative baseplate assembly protein [Pyrinomonadaceae bacterium]
MTGEPPKIDPRSATAVAQELRQELSKLAGLDPAWADFNPDVGLSRAMIGIFSRLAEIVIRRLNDVPGKNQLAFLNLLGASMLPPQPARVPLTFTLTAGSTTDSVVPAGTQVAAPPAEGEKEPVIYETERELVVTAARLDSAFVREPEQDRFADRGGLLAATSAGAPAFAGDRQIEHYLYVGHDGYFGLPALKAVRLKFALAGNVEPDPPGEGRKPDPRQLRWEIWNGTSYVPIAFSDKTDNLTRSGEMTCNAPALRDNSPIPPAEVGGWQSRWLRCRLVTPITTAPKQLDTMVRESQLPTVSAVTVSVRLDSKVGDKDQRLPPEAAFFNDLPLDTTKDFLPFGPNPGYGDTFYFARSEAFSRPGAKITLAVSSTDPAAAGIRTPAASEKLRLRWEFWNGAKWAELATVDREGAAKREEKPLPATEFADTTKAFTAREGAVTFTLPASAAATPVNGVENVWVRVRIVAGNYGEPPRYDPVKEGDVVKGYTAVGGTLAPPSLGSLGVDYVLETPEARATLVACNDFVCENPGVRPFKPFRPSGDAEPALYLGFSLPPSRAEFPNRKLSLYVEPVVFRHGERYGPLWPLRSRKAGAPGSAVSHRFSATYESRGRARGMLNVSVYGSAWAKDKTSSVEVGAGETTELEISVPVHAEAAPDAKDRGFVRLTWEGAPDVEHVATFETFASEEDARRRPQLSWEYWDGGGWSSLVAHDDTRNLTLPGLVEFIAPGDFAAHDEFGLRRFWLRVRWKSGGYEFPPHLRRLLLNTMTAEQAVTVRDELLGSSDASADQVFRTTRSPVLPGEQLEVREPEMPSHAEAASIRREEGDDAVRVVENGAGMVREVWVRWHATSDFYSSGPRDRHYVLDRLTGEVRFGDGRHGMIPPALAGNLRLRRYRTGGGTAGNRPAGVVTQLRTTVPYIDKVTNIAPAAGGAAAEDFASLIERAPRTLRHGGRAVTIEDYEDLGREATPEVARVKCVPLYDLASDPDATHRRLGAVSLIVVPRSAEPRPVPSLELIGRVRHYLDRHRAPNADLFVVGPDYVRVDIEVTLGVSSLEGAREVEAAVSRSLARFLHPLTGGLDGRGWDFGRRPYKSDLYALLEGTEGVDHVIALRVTETKERADAATTERALVYSGTHKISLTLAEA